MHVQVCIVGAGPGGALLAYLLAKEGIRTLLLERTASIGQAFRGEHLNTEGEEILTKHGLYTKLQQIGCLPMTSLRYWHRGELVNEVHAAEGEHFGIHSPQKNLLHVLIDAASQYDAFSYQLKTSVKELLMHADGTYYGVKAVHDGHEQTIFCDVIIGADGRNSTVRRQANIEAKVMKHGYDLLWARFPAPAQWQPSIDFALLGDDPISVFSQTGGYVQIGWQIAEKSFAMLRKQPFEPIKELLIATLPTLRDAITEHVNSWCDFILLDVYSSEVDTWQKNGVLFLGDAVHTMTPTGAFGLNSALRDADVLSALIVDGLDEFRVLQCETMRKEQVKALQELQRHKETAFADAFVVLQ